MSHTSVELFRFYEDPCQDCGGKGLRGEAEPPKFVIVDGDQPQKISKDIININMKVDK